MKLRTTAEGGPQNLGGGGLGKDLPQSSTRRDYTNNKYIACFSKRADILNLGSVHLIWLVTVIYQKYLHTFDSHILRDYCKLTMV